MAISLWRRVGDLYHDGNFQGPSLVWVTFYHLTSPHIKRVEVSYDTNTETLRVILHGSLFIKDSLTQACAQFFKEHDYTKTTIGLVALDIVDKTKQEKMVQYLEYLQRQFPQNELDTIILELKQITAYVNKLVPPLGRYGHVISEGVFAESHIHTYTKQLLSVANFPDSNTIVACKKALIQGEDPNQCNIAGMNTLDLLILSSKYRALLADIKKIATLLLCYGLDPISRKIQTRTQNTIELLYKYECLEIFQIIMNAYTTLEKNILSAATKPHIISTDIFLRENILITALHFSTGKTITVHLQRANLITPEQKSLILKLFQQYTDISQLEKMFNEDFTSANTFVQLIYDGRQLIGVNSFEMLPYKKDYIYLHSVYSILDAYYRGSGLITLIAFQPAYALQLLAKTKKIGIFFCAAHYNSYRLIEDFDHFPMIQLKQEKVMVEYLLNKIFTEKVELIHDLLTCYYVEKDFRIKDTPQTKSPRLFEELFYNYILNNNSTNTNGATESKSAPVLFLCEANTLKYSHLLLRAGIHFFKYIGNYAKCLDMLFSEELQPSTHSIFKAANIKKMTLTQAAPLRPFSIL